MKDKKVSNQKRTKNILLLYFFMELLQVGLPQVEGVFQVGGRGFVQVGGGVVQIQVTVTKTNFNSIKHHSCADKS